jgi:outer membrane biogenesis lipoprotein LolB
MNVVSILFSILVVVLLTGCDYKVNKPQKVKEIKSFVYEITTEDGRSCIVLYSPTGKSGISCDWNSTE